MPYHGVELQAFLCNKWAKKNGFLYDLNGDAFISVANGYEVSIPLADDNRDVCVTYYQACGLLKLDVRKSSMPNPYGKRKRCKTAKEAVSVLTSTPDKKTPHITAQATHANCPTHDVTPANCPSHDEADVSTGNVTAQATPVNCTDIKFVSDADYVGDRELVTSEDGKLYRMRVGGDDAGVVDGECRSYECERAKFVELKNKCLQSCNPYKTCAFTLGTYILQSFSDIQKAVLNLLKKDKGFLFKNYENLKCGFMFLEPYKKGGFHCHMILCFYDEIPDDLHENILREWKKNIIVPTETYKLDEYLVEMREFSTAEEFVKYLDYLNPTSKKKLDRRKHYPRGRRARQGYGDFESPNTAVLPMNEAKKLTEHEHIALRHEIKILNASSTVSKKKEDLKFHQFTFYYTVNKNFWNSIIANGQTEEKIPCDVKFVPPITAPEPQSCEYECEDDRDCSGWSDYVFEHFTMLHRRC